MTFHERKQKRKEHYDNYVKGWKLRRCSACNGSGYYDHNDSPDCGACNGSGKERYSPLNEEKEMIHWITQHGPESWTRLWWESYKKLERGKQFFKTEEGQKIEKIFYP